MEHKLSAHSEMNGFLEKYNYFHDALLKSVKFSSNDFFSDKPPNLEITGQFNAALSIHHYNYLENTGQTIYCISVELCELGLFSFCSTDGEERSRHWALTKIEIDPLKDAPGRWLMTIISNTLDVVTGKWIKMNLAQIEFAYLVFRVVPRKSTNQ